MSNGLIIWVVVFIVSLALLLKSSEYFVSFSEKIGLSFRLSPLLIGALILGFGTSLPELVTSIFAVRKGNSEILMGNVIGSNIANILLVMGLTAIIGKHIKINIHNIRVELLLLIGSAALLSVFILNNDINYVEAVALLFGLAFYLYYTLNSSPDLEELGIEGIGEENVASWFHWPLLALSGAGIFVGAKYTVDSVIQISHLLNIGIDVIALSVVALGTSLPELIVSVIAVKKGQSDMALGNIIGSNIFNIFSVVSIPRFFGEIHIPDDVIFFSLPVMIVATLLFFITIWDRKIIRWEGVVFVILYVLYNLELFGGFFRDWLF